MHSILNYGIILWGSSLYSMSIQDSKEKIRIMTNSAKRASCCSLFRQLGILPLQEQYILLISMFIITNRKLFKFNYQVYPFHTRPTNDLHPPPPQINLTEFQKGICYMGIMSFNHLPTEIKSMFNDTTSFKSKLPVVLLQNSFIS
jgi:hypothetical protein